MSLPITPRAVLARLMLAAVAALPAVASARAAGDLPMPLALDVHESYRLLSSDFYRKVEEQQLLDAARDALVAAARKHGVRRITLPPLHVESSVDGTVDALDLAIENVAEAGHFSVTDAAYAAIDGMAKAVDDRYTQFLTPDEFKTFNTALDPERIIGIGVLTEPDAHSGLVRTWFVLPNTPADRAGLEAGDLISSIDGTSTKGLSQDAVSTLFRGKLGTPLHVQIVRSAEPAPRDYVLTRVEVQPPTVIYRMLPEDVGYIAVAAFGHSTADEFNIALDRVKSAGAKALVIDLRNNGGGYVESAVDISSRFITNKTLLTIQERNAPEETIASQDDSTHVSLPVTVLVNQYTASASEIAAGALQDDGIAVLVGTKTYGKGVMQTITPLPDGAAIKITTAHYLTPLRHDINLRGIDPDVKVAENRNPRFGEIDKDDQLRAALQFLEKKTPAIMTETTTTQPRHRQPKAPE